MSKLPRETRVPRERALLCGARGPLCDAGPSVDLSEVRGLAAAAGAVVVGTELLQRVNEPNPATLLGKGKVDEIRREIERVHPDLVVVDNDLSPAQARNLEKAWSVRVVDRSELILDIFSKRAQTRQARLQVELAQNEYMSPRLRRMWTHLETERLEGAIGTRGPGETQLETDKRLLKKRIQDLREELREIEERKQREVRSRAEQFTIGLVGYTNAGKSTLLNRLTGSDEFVADMLFATLDTRTRQWKLPDQRTVLVSDTVGFLQRLPHHLVACFHATLEEALHADLLLHVVDASHPDAAAQMDAVEQVLASLSHDARTALIVFNKADQVRDPLVLQSLRSGRPAEAVAVSALNGAGIDELERAVMRQLDRRSALVDVFVPFADGRTESVLRQLCSPQQDEFDDERAERRLRVRLTDGQFGSLSRQIPANVRLVVVEPAEERTSAFDERA